jgi:hypothetical protein
MSASQELDVTLRVDQAHVVFAVIPRLDDRMTARLDARPERIEPFRDVRMRARCAAGEEAVGAVFSLMRRMDD